MADAKINKVSLVVLALLFSCPAVAEESLTNYRPLEWQGGVARGTAGDETTAEAIPDAAEAGQAPSEGEAPTETAGQEDVWQRIRNGFGIDEEASRNPLVGLHESWFAARPESVLRLVERSRQI